MEHGSGADDDGDDYQNTVTDCDAFSQIVKELVDNAVDACCMVSGPQPQSKSKRRRGKTPPNKASSSSSSSSSSSATTSSRRVRVVIEPFIPPLPSSTDNLTETSTADDDDDDDDTSEAPTAVVKTKRARDILRVTVSDNGVGMTSIQDCVEAFRSSKANNTTATATAGDKSSTQQQQQHMTAGRYGIGLTLCLLHAQRLVPNSSTCITSATATASHFTRTYCVVDTEGDSVRCVDQTLVPKRTPEESGTSVSLLIPVCYH